MKKTEHGFTLIEMLATLAIGLMMMTGITALIDSSLNDMKGQQTALYQAQVTEAASKYIKDNYATLMGAGGATQTTPVAISAGTLKAANYLSPNFNMANPYGQTPCVLVLQPAPGKLDALVVTEGANSIPLKDIAYVAGSAGQGGGYIQLTPPATQVEAFGAFGTWKIAAAGLPPYLSRNCSGTAAGTGHLATALFYDGPDQPSSDFLYRNAVPGRPELNRMNTPLHMAAQAVEGSSTDPLCVAADPTTQGRIAVDSSGAVLSCQAGVWKRQGSQFWQDAVASYNLLPSSGTLGETRIVTGLSRAFTWNGTGWVALGVDQNGDLIMPGKLQANSVQANFVQLGQAFVYHDACSPNGTVGRDANGALMSCQSGIWRKVSDTSVGARIFNQPYSHSSSLSDDNIFIDLNTIVGTRPLHLSGESYCEAWNFAMAQAKLTIYDESMNAIGYGGGCKSESVDTPGSGRSGSGTYLELITIPENARYLKVFMHADGDPRSWSTLTVHLFSSL